VLEKWLTLSDMKIPKSIKISILNDKKYAKEFSILISFMKYNTHNFNINTRANSSTNDNNIMEYLYKLHTTIDRKEYRKEVLSLPLLYQRVIVSLINKSKYRLFINEFDKFVLPYSKFIQYIKCDDKVVLKNTFTYTKGNLEYPFYIISNKYINRNNRIGYLYFNSKGHLITNIGKKYVDALLNKYDIIDTGAIFVKCDCKYKYLLLFKANSNTISSIVRKKYNITDTISLKLVNTYNELIKELDSTNYTNYITINSKGISTLKVKNKALKFKVVDFVLDNNYEAVGIVGLYKDKSYKMYLSNVPLDIIGKTVKGICRVYDNNIIGKIKYIGE
jgi:hypothetical protein